MSALGNHSYLGLLGNITVHPNANLTWECVQNSTTSTNTSTSSSNTSTSTNTTVTTQAPDVVRSARVFGEPPVSGAVSERAILRSSFVLRIARRKALADTVALYERIVPGEEGRGHEFLANSFAAALRKALGARVLTIAHRMQAGAASAAGGSGGIYSASVIDAVGTLPLMRGDHDVAAGTVRFSTKQDFLDRAGLTLRHNGTYPYRTVEVTPSPYKWTQSSGVFG